MPITAQSGKYFEIALTMVPLVGPVVAKTLISYCGGAQAVFEEKKHRLMRIPGVGSHIAESIHTFHHFDRVVEELAFAEKHRIQILSYTDTEYPQRLKSIPDAPSVIYYKGNTNLNAEKVVAIVGTRKASEYGKHIIEQISEVLASYGCLIVSGLALGIDIQAHKQALHYHLPTVGVLAHGLDRIYPTQHKHVAHKMLDNGGLLTEFMSGTNPDRENFPTRNRIVAGMCDVLLVIETAERGGAMITAELANGYNKELMAVPGRIGDIYSAGCNKLIAENKAAIITHAESIPIWMGWNQNKPIPVQASLALLNLGELEMSIVSLIRQKQKVSIDDLAFELKIDNGSIALKLLEMEMTGIIRSLPGKYYEMV